MTVASWPREPFRNLIERVSGVSTTWARDAMPMVPQMMPPAGATFNPSIPTPQGAGLAAQAVIVMRIMQGHVRGVDETRYSYDAGSDKLIATQNGIRVYGLSFRCTVLGFQEPSPAEYMESLRSRMDRPSVVDELNAMGLSLNSTVGFYDIQIPNGNIAGRACEMDMRFNWAFIDVDTTSAGDYIANVGIDGTFIKEDGTTLTGHIDIEE